MNVFNDIKSKGLLHAKGLLFLFLGLATAGLLFLESQSLRTLVLLVVTIWSFCRFYYYLFYVLENYAGRNQKYAGLFDALRYVFNFKQK